MNTLAVSSYSVREHLGPIVFDFVDPQGNDVHFELPYPKLLRISEFPARAKETFGVDAIETVAFQFDGIDDPEIDAFEQALATNDVKLLNIAIDVGDLLAPDADKRANDIELIERWIERFAAMGSRFVRVNPGSPFSANHGEQPPAHLVEALQLLGTFANERGARLLVENHGGPSSNPAWMRQLLDAVGQTSLGLLLDLGNFDVLMAPMMAMFFGGEAEQKDPGEVFAGLDLTTLYEGIEALADKAELVSLKTHHVGDDGSVGPVDLVHSLDILAKHDYQGALTVEYEGNGGDPWAKSARVLEVAKAVQ